MGAVFKERSRKCEGDSFTAVPLTRDRFANATNHPVGALAGGDGGGEDFLGMVELRQ